MNTTQASDTIESSWKKTRDGSKALAWACLLIPLACASDWFFHWSWMSILRLGSTEMSLGAAFCLVALGSALAIPHAGASSAPGSVLARLRTLCAGLALLYCAGAALEYVTGATFLDLNEYQSGRGRITILALMGCVLGSLSVIAMDRSLRPAAYWTALGVGLCGAGGLASHAISLDYLYIMPQSTKIPVSTSACLILLALALWNELRATCFVGDFDEREVEARHILRAIDAMIVAMVAIVSVTCFGITQSRSEELMRGQMSAANKSRRIYFENELNSRAALASQLGSRPAIAKALRALGPDAPKPATAPIATRPDFKASAQGLLSEGFSYFAYFDSAGSLVAAAGDKAVNPEQEISVKLNRRGSFSLAWANGGFLLKNRIALLDAVGVAGYIESEQPMPELTLAQKEGMSQGNTGDLVVCGLDRVGGVDKQRCYPFRRGKAGLYPAILDGKPLPLTRAGRGEETTDITTDFRRERVMVAIGPVGKTGLGMGTKMDMVELYAPIRAQFAWAFPFMAALVGFGMWIVRWRLHPLVVAFSQSREQLLVMATHDSLTRLPNRVLFTQRLAECLERGAGRGELMALLYIDLDDFKFINDNHGHKAGDDALVWFANHLSASVRSGDTVARLGGDEFTIILDNITQPSDAAMIVQKIHDRLSAPGQKMPHKNIEAIRASIGIALCQSGSKSSDDLITEADSELYRVKNERRRKST